MISIIAYSHWMVKSATGFVVPEGEYLTLGPKTVSVTQFPAVLIPACASSSPAFFIMYSKYKLNKQGDYIQTWCTSFPFWNQSAVPCPVLTVASWPAYRFLRRKVRWSRIPISWRIFHCLLWSTQSKFLA